MWRLRKELENYGIRGMGAEGVELGDAIEILVHGKRSLTKFSNEGRKLWLTTLYC